MQAILKYKKTVGEPYVWAFGGGRLIKGALSKVLAEIQDWLNEHDATAVAEIELHLKSIMSHIGQGVDLEVIEDGAVILIATTIVGGLLTTEVLTEQEFRPPNPDQQHRAPKADD